MIQRLIPVIVFTAVTICIIQLINYSFGKTYKQIEYSVQAPYQKAQQVYEHELAKSGY